MDRKAGGKDGGRGRESVLEGSRMGVGREWGKRERERGRESESYLREGWR